VSRRVLTAFALTGAAALAAAPAHALPHAAKKPPVKKVGVYDNYYLPTKLSVARRTTIAWRWTDEVADLHDVKLAKGPKGVKRFASLEGTAGYVYKKTLTTPGVYKFICSFHEADGMIMSITVRK
jgi:plastocyanin